MLECHYAKEPVDLRLLVLRLWKCAGGILLAVLSGTLVLGGGYCLKNIVFAPREYAATSLYQVEYVLDPVTDNEYTYINGAAWNQWMDTKEFLDLLYSHLEGTEDAGIDRDTMKGYLSASLQIDLRMPDTTVTTPDRELSLRLAKAVEKSMEDFAAGQKGIDNIRVVDPAEEAPINSTARPLNAWILSAVVSTFVTLVVVLLMELGDDGIWLPATFKKRYGIEALGTVESPGFAENAGWLLRGFKTVAVLPVGAESVTGEVLDSLKEAIYASKQKGGPDPLVTLEPLPGLWKMPGICDRIRETDGLVLAVESGSRMGRKLEEALSFLETQDCAVTAALLVHADEKLIRRYYWRESLFKKNPGCGKQAGDRRKERV